MQSNPKFCATLDVGDAGYISLAEIILRMQNTLSEKYSVPLNPTPILADVPPVAAAALEERSVKYARTILKVVYKHLSDASAPIFTNYRQSINGNEAMTWPKARKTLLTCFATKMEVQEIRHTFSNCAQLSSESPQAYFNRLIQAIHCLRIGLDASLGDGLDGSAAVANAVTLVSEPFYFMNNYNNNDTLKNRYFRGLSQEIRTEWNHCHSALRAQAMINGGTLTQLVEWAERFWINSNKAGLKRSAVGVKKSLHVSFGADELDDNEDINQVFQIAKKSKGINPLQQILDSNNLLVESQRQHNESLVSTLMAAFKANNNFSNHVETKDQGSRSTRPPLNPRNRFSGRSITTLVKPKSCWTCRGDHFAQHCPHISRLEQLILILNRVYRMNRGRTEPATTIEKLCIAENVAPPTVEENALLDSIYKPLRESATKRSMGKNSKSYCHFCHAVGHWTRECKSFCPYCKINGHGWETCTNSLFISHVRARLQSGFPSPDSTVLNALFSLIEIGDDGDDFIMEDVY